MGPGESEEWLWWGSASSAQLVAAVAATRWGLVGGSGSMPFKAFAVASLFVGAGATGAVAALQASGVRGLEDWKQIGASIRSQLGAPPPEGRTGGDGLPS